MKKYLFIGLFLMLTFAFVSESNAQTVSGSIGKGSVSKGKTVRAYVVLNIPSGYHVNSRYPRSEYLIPTTVNVSARGVSLGNVSYPAGKNRKYSYSESTISVYEGRVVFGFNVTVPNNFRGNRVSVRAVVKFQPCTDEVCYAPKTKEVTLSARVR